VGSDHFWSVGDVSHSQRWNVAQRLIRLVYMTGQDSEFCLRSISVTPSLVAGRRSSLGVRRPNPTARCCRLVAFVGYAIAYLGVVVRNSVPYKRPGPPKAARLLKMGRATAPTGSSRLVKHDFSSASPNPPPQGTRREEDRDLRGVTKRAGTRTAALAAGDLISISLVMDSPAVSSA
jgi:hypothetical protein